MKLVTYVLLPFPMNIRISQDIYGVWNESVFM